MIKIQEGCNSKKEQVVQSIIREIEHGNLAKDTLLPSITSLSKTIHFSRDTIEKAYKELQDQGYIRAVPNVGNFVVGKKDQRLKILFIFNKISSFKNLIYEGFLRTLGSNAKVDIQVHHYNLQLLNEIIDTHLGAYHYYVVMPHFDLAAPLAGIQATLRKIPARQLVLLDKNVEHFNDTLSVYQDFHGDIYHAFSSVKKLFDKYHTIEIVMSRLLNHPPEIAEGALRFGAENAKAIVHSESITEQKELQLGVCYVVTDEADLPLFIKKTREKGWTLGKDLGLIAYNETALNEILDITVISTQFRQMGETLAQLLLEQQTTQVKNPFVLIQRSSL